MMHDNDELKILLVKTSQGDQSAFSALYDQTAPTLLAVANRIVGRRELGEEVLHDVFVKVWHKSVDFDPKVTQVMGWLVAMTRNRALDLVASANVSKLNLVDTTDTAVQNVLDICLAHADLSDEGSNDAASMHDKKQESGHLRDCISGLAFDERQTITLAYYHGLSHQALADHLQRPLGTVKTICRRALTKLKSCLERCAAGGAQ